MNFFMKKSFYHLSPHIINLLGYNKRLFKFFKVQINGNPKIRKLKISDPRMVEIGDNSVISNVKINGKWYFLVLPNSKVSNIEINRHTIITPKNVYYGNEVEREVITFSFDLEGGVGLSHASSKEFQKLRNFWKSKEIAKKLIKILDKYELKSTWGVCGHLFLRECNGNHGFGIKDYYGDWFLYDPKTNYKENSSWYMPDLIEEMKSNNLIETGYHSFGHFKYWLINEFVAEKDMKIKDEIEKEYNLKMKSFIFPYNRINHIDILLKHKIKFIRGYINGVAPLGKVIDFKKFIYIDTNLFVSPLNMEMCIKKIKTCKPVNFNIFTHPWNWLGDNNFREFEKFCKFLSQYRDLMFKFNELENL